MFKILGTMAIMTSLTACWGSSSDDGNPAASSSFGATPPLALPTGPATRATYLPTSDPFPNPERGFYGWADLVDGRDFSGARQDGMALVYAGVILNRDAPLDAGFLGKLHAGFAAIRAAGLKVILRFLYSSAIGDPDAPKARILEHILQLTPVLQANSDVIAVLQAGFIGAWGEWHGSMNGLDNPTDRGDILHALLDAIPSSRTVQVRTPHFKAEFSGPEALSEAEAFSGIDRARLGHQNDAFLASDTDMGTYQFPVEAWKNWVAQETRFVPCGGETAAFSPPQTSGPHAVSEMARLHWTYLNSLYHPSVIQAWRNEGCYEEIASRLGYRISLVEATWSAETAPGGELALAVKLRNDGFAAMVNPRGIRILLSRAGEEYSAALQSVDPRRWEGGMESTFTVRLRVPAQTAPGEYRLALWLPDDAPALRYRPEYAVRFANAAVWDPFRGSNVLTEECSIAVAAPGPVDPSASAFAEIP